MRGLSFALVGPALAGGALIGLASAALLLCAGRIAGVSGLAAEALGLAGRDRRALALAFILGLPLGALLARGLGVAAEPHFAPPLYLVVGGLLVGFGARLGSGCTSGHGVCGVSRLSKRSLVATASFMATGAVVVSALRQTGFAW